MQMKLQYFCNGTFRGMLCWYHVRISPVSTLPLDLCLLEGKES